MTNENNLQQIMITAILNSFQESEDYKWLQSANKYCNITSCVLSINLALKCVNDLDIAIKNNDMVVISLYINNYLFFSNLISKIRYNIEQTLLENTKLANTTEPKAIASQEEIAC